MRNLNNHTNSQSFDIKPTKVKESFSVRFAKKVPKRKIHIYQLGMAFSSEETPIYHKYSEQALEMLNQRRKKKMFKKDAPKQHKTSEDINVIRMIASFSVSVAAIVLVIGSFSFFGKGKKVESDVLGVSSEAYSSLTAAIGSIKNQDFQKSSLEFQVAYDDFSQASNDLNKLGGFLIDVTRFFPKISKLASGKNALDAGKHISLAGESLNKVLETLHSLENPLGSEGGQGSISLLDVFLKTQGELEIAAGELRESKSNLDKIKVDDLPDDKQEQFILMKDNLPLVISSIEGFLNNGDIFIDLLGGNGPRKYLFLFQNNQEMRPTGGFIGSYGLLDIQNGKVKKFFIDGIFNPDGQLTDKIVPPKPIQKISEAWSLHDSNWFPDFPVSAEKAILFYEKTGGPTASGIITLTPTVMEKLLEITGPVEMKEYGVILDSENFIEKTQYEVEDDYDEEENEPKKILADLAPIILDKVFNARDVKTISKTISVISEALDQKHILLYSRNEDLQKIISSQGWSGEILDSSKDYLSVVNTNINGYKTDGVIEESIKHISNIQPDGSITDTVTITRKHNGGNAEFDWWNRVNANYMRVYVPKGSTLLEVEGQTREFNESPLDYEALKFRIDPDVQKEEQSISIHEDSGTRVYEDAGKTVFANWTYVSPQEIMEITYKYRLPFKLDPADSSIYSYSLLAQKQAGSVGSGFKSEIEYPENWILSWSYPSEVKSSESSLKISTELYTDKFIGAVFSNKK